MDAVTSKLGWGQGTYTEASWGPLRTVGRESLRWLWPGRVPLGKMTLLVGDPGLGKSLLALDMAARVTRGLPWPDEAVSSSEFRVSRSEGGAGEPQLETRNAERGTPRPAGSVVLLSGEDDAADTILPRLEAAGGDADRVIVLHSMRQRANCKDVAFSLGRDMPLLAAEVAQRADVRLVILDPVSACLGLLDGCRNAPVRAMLAPVLATVAQMGVALVAVTHLTKRSYAAVIHRAMGSVAFGAAARAVWAVGPDPREAGRMLFLPVKCNLAGRLTGLAYRIVPSPDCPAVPVLAWEPEEVAMTAEEAFEAAASRRPTRLGRAIGWLAALLAAGPMLAQEVERRAHDAGFSSETLRRARRELGVPAHRTGFGSPCTWRLPVPEAGVPAGDDTPSASTPSPEAASASGRV